MRAKPPATPRSRRAGRRRRRRSPPRRASPAAATVGPGEQQRPPRVSVLGVAHAAVVPREVDGVPGARARADGGGRGVGGAGARERGEDAEAAVDGEEEDARVVEEGALRAVAVVDVPVDDEDALGALREEFPRGDRHRVEDAETVRHVRLRVVARRAHRGEAVAHRAVPQRLRHPEDAARAEPRAAHRVLVQEDVVVVLRLRQQLRRRLAREPGQPLHEKGECTSARSSSDASSSAASARQRSARPEARSSRTSERMRSGQSRWRRDGCACSESVGSRSSHVAARLSRRRFWAVIVPGEVAASPTGDNLPIPPSREAVAESDSRCIEFSASASAGWRAFFCGGECRAGRDAVFTVAWAA